MCKLSNFCYLVIAFSLYLDHIPYLQLRFGPYAELPCSGFPKMLRLTQLFAELQKLLCKESRQFNKQKTSTSNIFLETQQYFLEEACRYHRVGLISRTSWNFVDDAKIVLLSVTFGRFTHFILFQRPGVVFYAMNSAAHSSDGAIFQPLSSVASTKTFRVVC